MLNLSQELEAVKVLKWLYNLLCLNLYVFSLECVKNSASMYEDTLTDFETVSKDLFGQLDTSIRYSLQKHGVSIKENVYIGFDTEYQQQTPIKNKLISAQLAVASQTVVKVPRQRDYKISLLDEKGKIIHMVKNSNVFNYVKLENSVKMCVDRARWLKNKEYDSLVFKLSEGLKMVRGVSPLSHKVWFVWPRQNSICLAQPFLNVACRSLKRNSWSQA